MEGPTGVLSWGRLGFSGVICVRAPACHIDEICGKRRDPQGRDETRRSIFSQDPRSGQTKQLRSRNMYTHTTSEGGLMSSHVYQVTSHCWACVSVNFSKASATDACNKRHVCSNEVLLTCRVRQEADYIIRKRQECNSLSLSLSVSVSVWCCCVVLCCVVCCGVLCVCLCVCLCVAAH